MFFLEINELFLSCRGFECTEKIDQIEEFWVDKVYLTAHFYGTVYNNL